MAHILVTGGTGKTGRRVVAELAARGLEARAAVRRPPPNGVRFDWSDPDTFDPALHDIGAIYLVAPTGNGDPLAAMEPFLQRALAAGVRRYVLLSASALPEGGPLMGQVHAFLHHAAPEWVVLRPSWFMQNFSEQQHFPTIRDEGVIYTATGDGRVAFVHADDIAAVAVAALLGQAPCNQEYILTGPRALSYDEVAAIIAAAAGRPVMHRRLTEEQMAGWLSGVAGVPPAFAAALAAMDTAVANGAEDRVSPDVQTVTGRSPISFETFAAENRTIWASS
jgi:ergot alkaloid biosynthesis protein